MGERGRGAIRESARRLSKQVPHVHVNYYASKQCGTSVTASCKIAECPWWLSQTSFPSDVLLLPASSRRLLAHVFLVLLKVSTPRTYSSSVAFSAVIPHFYSSPRTFNFHPLPPPPFTPPVYTFYFDLRHRSCCTRFRRHRYLPVNLKIFTLPVELRFCKRTQSLSLECAVNSKVAISFAFESFFADISIFFKLPASIHPCPVLSVPFSPPPPFFLFLAFCRAISIVFFRTLNVT